MFKLPTRKWANYLKFIFALLVFVGATVSAHAEVVHFNTLDGEQTRSKNLRDAYERQFTVTTDTRITSIELKLSETQSSDLLAFGRAE